MKTASTHVLGSASGNASNSPMGTFSTYLSRVPSLGGYTSLGVYNAVESDQARATRCRRHPLCVWGGGLELWASDALTDAIKRAEEEDDDFDRRELVSSIEAAVDEAVREERTGHTGEQLESEL